GLGTDARIELRLNQGVERAALEQHLAVTAAGKPAKIRLEQPDPANPRRWAIHPASAWPRNAPVRVTVAAGLRGAEGPLPMAAPFEQTVHTYGPLAIERVACDEDTPDRRCNVTGGVQIELSNEVKIAHLKRAVRFAPPVAIRWPGWADDASTTRYLSLDARFVPGRSYTLRIDGGLVDEHGQALGQAVARPIA